MTEWHGPAETVEAGLLVRHLDGELDHATAEALEGHLARCEACRTLAASLEARARRVGDALEGADFVGPDAAEWRAVLDAVRAGAGPGRAGGGGGGGSAGAAPGGGGGTGRGRRDPAAGAGAEDRARTDGTAGGARPEGRRVRRLLAAGWVLAILGAAAVASPPLRAWVAGQWSRIAGPDPATPAPGATAGGPASAALEFHPSGPVLEVVVETIQAAGTLTVRFADEAGAARVTVSGGGDESLAVGGGGVRIDNVPDARASWEVVVPAGVERVTVRVGAREPVVAARGAGGAEPVVVELGGGAAGPGGGG